MSHKAARTCYGHLAGELGCTLTDRLLAAGILMPHEGERGRAEFVPTEAGHAWFLALGIDTRTAIGKRLFAPQCMDGTERRPHLGGWLGRALCQAWIERDYVRRPDPASRALILTSAGKQALAALHDAGSP